KPKNQTADDVDQNDENRRDRIAFNEFAGAVHRTVKVGLEFDLFSTLFCLGFGDETCVQVGINRHLLARHRIKRKSGNHFSYAASAVRDHHKLHDDKNQKRNKADNKVAAHHKIAERFD